MTIDTDNTSSIQHIEQAVSCLQNGGVIAYPTEAVFGLGCRVDHEAALNRILAIKQRELSKGVIVIAAHWQQVQSFTRPIGSKRLALVHASWPGPVTWLFPASQHAPAWITGAHQTIALRVSAHPIVQQLCLQLGAALVSTSANVSHEPPLCHYDTVNEQFADQVDYIVPGAVGGLTRPTTICDALSGQVIRAGG